MMSDWLIAIVASVCILIVGWMWASKQCESQAKAMGFNSRWHVMTECMIEPHPGDWIPLKNYRGL